MRVSQAVATVSILVVFSSAMSVSAETTMCLQRAQKAQVLAAEARTAVSDRMTLLSNLMSENRRMQQIGFELGQRLGPYRRDLTAWRMRYERARRAGSQQGMRQARAVIADIKRRGAPLLREVALFDDSMRNLQRDLRIAQRQVNDVSTEYAERMRPYQNVASSEAMLACEQQTRDELTERAGQLDQIQERFQETQDQIIGVSKQIAATLDELKDLTEGL